MAVNNSNPLTFDTFATLLDRVTKQRKYSPDFNVIQQEGESLEDYLSRCAQNVEKGKDY